MIGTGDKLPDMELMILTEDGPSNVSSTEIFGSKRVVLIGLPGAFTGTCSGVHLPGFLENADDIKAKGIDTIALVSVNDHYVLKAWADQHSAMDDILFIADWNSAFTQAIDMEFDASGGGLGKRSKRYSMVVDDGTVEILNVEGSPGEAVASGAAKLLEQL